MLAADLREVGQGHNPCVEVAESNAGPNTLDDLLLSRPAGVVL
jgi:hypothetical protein